MIPTVYGWRLPRQQSLDLESRHPVQFLGRVLTDRRVAPGEGVTEIALPDSRLAGSSPSSQE
jgi:hypothetical protein